MGKKWVYLFSEGNRDMRDLLGGKGAGLAEMTNAKLPVPPGFTCTTEACLAFFDEGRQFPEGMWDQVLAAMKDVEAEFRKYYTVSLNNYPVEDAYLPVQQPMAIDARRGW